MTTKTQDVRRAEFIQGLRDLIDLYETHPDMPIPVYTTLDVFTRTRETMASVARMSSWQKRYSGDWFTLVKNFGQDLALHINLERAEVCRKVVTGTRVVPAQPEHTVEEFEWVCEEKSLLEGVANG